jgi:hypothetical protein
MHTRKKHKDHSLFILNKIINEIEIMIKDDKIRKDILSRDKKILKKIKKNKEKIIKFIPE